MNLRLSLAVALSLLVAACVAEDPNSPHGKARALAARLSGNAQSRRLTCESRSGADLLAAHGIAATERDVFERLPRSDNPDLGFVGDPDGEPHGLPPDPYGVHAEPMAAALRSLGLDARAEHGRDIEWLKSETREGRPVIAWVTGSYSLARPVTLTDRTGRSFVAVRGEHTVLVIEVRGSDVVVVDPGSGRRAEVDAPDFVASWALLGHSAVSATGPKR
jgi:uncharacterized protein YvpB